VFFWLWLGVVISSVGTWGQTVGAQWLFASYWHIFPVAGWDVGFYAVQFAALPISVSVLGGIGGVLLFFGAVRPQLLKYPSAVWWRFAGVLAYVNSRILLTIMFSLLLVPLSLLWRVIGKDPLARRRKKFEGWTPYPARYRDRTHFERMF
jgi:hypothetical protein